MKIFYIGARIVGYNTLQALLENNFNIIGALILDDSKEKITVAHKKFDDLVSKYSIPTKKFTSLKTNKYDEWIESFKINTIAPYQIVENFLDQIINSDLKKVISITSKMGSIDDNTSGGSYIYRSSKTALNSMMRSLTHDLKNQGIATLTLHPGWVRTDMGGPGGWIDSFESVQGMIKQIDKLTLKNSGNYLDYAGKSINW